MKVLPQFLIYSLLVAPNLLYAQHQTKRIFAIDAQINKKSSIKVSDNKLNKNIGVSTIGNVTDSPNIILNPKIKEGRYIIKTHAITNSIGKILMKNAKTKYESLFLTIQIDNPKKNQKSCLYPMGCSITRNW